VLDPALKITGATNNLQFNPQTVAVSGTLAFDGLSSWTQCNGSSNFGNISFAGINKILLPGILGKLGIGIGASFSARVPCPTATGAFSARVAPGTYVVTASANSSLGGLPEGTFVLVQQIAIP
jgi:hypothetical protein